jgi:hypothetical protein
VCRQIAGYRACALAGVDRVVYHAAGLGIVHNISRDKQRFYTKHNDDILCLAGSGDRAGLQRVQKQLALTVLLQ